MGSRENDILVSFPVVSSEMVFWLIVKINSGKFFRAHTLTKQCCDTVSVGRFSGCIIHYSLL